ncbi:MAG TPA: GNAT family N-acetyltransferase [bacterium]|nr:GNAT family N-acetyltransferase [bacterium]
MSDGVIIRTERLVLRDFRPDDWEVVHEYAVDPEVSLYMPWGPNSEDETRAFIERAIGYQTEDPRLHFELAITLAEDDHLIGGGGIRAADENFRAADMGYCLRRDAWGLGFGTESAVALISYGFEQLGVHRIWATCDSENVRSARVLEKSGMRLEGTRRDDTWLREHWRSTHVFAILENEWQPAGGQCADRADNASSRENPQ